MIAARMTYGVCGVCACQASGFGYAPSDRHRTMWVCDDPDCLTIARGTYTMSQSDWNTIERDAIRQAGSQAGAWLDSIGKTDMAALTADEWDQFCKRMIGEYRSHLATMVSTHMRLITSPSNKPPF